MRSSLDSGEEKFLDFVDADNKSFGNLKEQFAVIRINTENSLVYHLIIMCEFNICKWNFNSSNRILLWNYNR